MAETNHDGEENSSSGSAAKSSTQSWQFILRALKYRNYRLFFAGQTVSLIGTWMTRVATSWLVYRLTGSALLLGIVGFAGQIPTFVLGPFAGVWVDRWDRHRTLVVTQILSTLQSFALAGLALGGVITVNHIIWLSLAQGLINAFDMPARQSFVIEMVENREDLGNAIALNSSMVNVARLLGPSIAGVIIAVSSEGYCFLIDGISYLAVIASLLAMKGLARPQPKTRKAIIHELKEGWRYAFGSVPIRSILLLLALVSLIGMPYTVLLPIFAKEILHGGAHTLGFLMGASGIGALFGAMTLAARKSVRGLGRVVPIAAAIFGAGLIGLGLSRILWLSLILMLVVGGAMMEQMASSNTILQTIVEEDKRGRVMSLYSMAFLGMAPFGSLLAGTMAAKMGASRTVVFTGSVCIIAAAAFAFKLPAIRDAIRPIYRELGIIPESASGVQRASALITPPEE
jgi:MFS family permease